MLCYPINRELILKVSMFDSVITIESSYDLACRIANRLKIPVLKIEATTRSNGEILVNGSLEGKNILALFPNTGNSNHDFVSFLFMIDGFQNITAIIPYMPYSRADKSHELRVIAKMLESRGVTSIITLDIHSTTSISAFNIPVTNINSFEIFSEIYRKEDQNILIVSPDIGATQRASLFAEKLGKEIVFIDKITGILTGPQEIKGKKCIIVDDIIDTGRTLNIASRIIKEKGAESIEACITHGIFSAVDIFDYPIDVFYISESVVPINVCEKIKYLTTDEVFACNILGAPHQPMMI